YHAPFLFPFFATNLLGHLGGFAAWTILNLLLYAAIVQEAGAGEGETDTDRRDPIVRLAPFAFLPFLFGLYLGQVVILMAFGLHRALRAFTEGREWAAGCWLGVLLAKPQLGLIFVPVLLARRRWRALGGLMFVGAALAAATVLLVGVDGIRGYLATARAFSGFRQVPRLVYPWDMISLRGILVQLLPASVDDAQGLRVVHVLSAAMLLVLVPIWRGSWNPREPRFARQMLATMIVALLAGFHTHVHAAVLLVPPLLIALRGGQGSDPLRTLAVLLFLVPTFSVALNSNLVQGAWLIIILMAGMLGSIVVGLCRGERPIAMIARVEPPTAAISAGGLAR
ncbi:MAG: glycosyltransferase family 87 protein, partial [Isosphaeraceae bacterium]